MYFAELFPRSQLHHAITTELHSLLFWLVLFFITVTISLPFLLMRVYRALYLEPEVYGQPEIKDPWLDKEVVNCFGMKSNVDENEEVELEDIKPRRRSTSEKVFS